MKQDNILVSLWKHDKLVLVIIPLIVIGFLAVGWSKAQQYNDFESRTKSLAAECKPYAEMKFSDIPAKCVSYWRNK